MQTLRAVLTHLCDSLLVEPHDTQLCHITLNLPLSAISGYYRVVCDGAFAITTFCITPQHCIGSILQEPDGAYWDVPCLLTWSKLEEYPVEVPPTEALPWRVLLGLFATVEIIEAGPETQGPTIRFFRATELSDFGGMDELLVALDCSSDF